MCTSPDRRSACETRLPVLRYSAGVGGQGAGNGPRLSAGAEHPALTPSAPRRGGGLQTKPADGIGRPTASIKSTQPWREPPGDSCSTGRGGSNDPNVPQRRQHSIGRTSLKEGLQPSSRCFLLLFKMQGHVTIQRSVTDRAVRERLRPRRETPPRVSRNSSSCVRSSRQDCVSTPQSVKKKKKKGRMSPKELNRNSIFSCISCFDR